MDTILLNDALEALGIYTPPHGGEFHLTSPEILTLNDDGATWTKVPNMVANKLTGFSVTNGTLTKTIASGRFLFNGVSDLEVNKACTIYYGLAINDSVVTHEITEHTFETVSKVENISITAFADLTITNNIEVWARGDGTAGISLTANKLDITFLEA